MQETTCSVLDLSLISGSEDTEKEMATHSSIFDWEIPQTEEPEAPNSGLQDSDLT